MLMFIKKLKSMLHSQNACQHSTDTSESFVCVSECSVTSFVQTRSFTRRCEHFDCTYPENSTVSRTL